MSGIPHHDGGRLPYVSIPEACHALLISGVVNIPFNH